MTDGPTHAKGIGHNAPPEPVSLWHKHMWERARAEQAAKRPPMAVIRMQMARATELGMRYADYASLYRTAGRDPAGLLFTPAALNLRLARRLVLPDPVRAHLAGLKNCQLLALAPEGEAPEAFLAELREVSALNFASAAPMPAPQPSWQSMAQALRRVLDPLRLPGNAIALVGALPDENSLCASLCTAARLAGVLDSAAYFRPAT